MLATQSYAFVGVGCLNADRSRTAVCGGCD